MFLRNNHGQVSVGNLQFEYRDINEYGQTIMYYAYTSFIILLNHLKKTKIKITVEELSHVC